MLRGWWFQMGLRDWLERDLFIKGMKAYIGLNALLTFIALLLIGIQKGNVGGNYGAYFLLFGAILVGIGMVFGTISGLFFEWSRYPFQFQNVVSNGLLAYEQFVVGAVWVGIAYIIGIIMTGLAAIYVGRKTWSPKHAFGTWFLISTLGAVFALIGRAFGFLELYVQDFLWLGLAILVNGIVFGAVAAIASKLKR
jgi:hypothetical protein